MSFEAQLSNLTMWNDNRSHRYASTQFRVLCNFAFRENYSTHYVRGGSIIIFTVIQLNNHLKINNERSFFKEQSFSNVPAQFAGMRRL